MKRLTHRYRKWLRHRARQQQRPRGRNAKLAPVTVLGGTFLVRLGKTSEIPPETLCFDQNFDETVRFMAALRRRSKLALRGCMTWPPQKKTGQLRYLPRYHDFTKIKRITPSAALVLAAEYDRTRQIMGRTPLAVSLKDWDPEVRALLQEIGFFGLLDIEQNITAPPELARMVLPFRSGAKVEPTQVSGPDSVIGDLFAFIGKDPKMETQLYAAVIEAMNNVRDHAYPQIYFDGVRHVRNWWLTGAADRESRRLTLSLYDQGVTIPVSLPTTIGRENIVRAFFALFNSPYDPLDTEDDGRAIETAMQLSKTRTGLGHRGLGLAKIREVVDGLNGGRLRVISRCGEFIAEPSRKPVVKTSAIALEGTLVEIEAAF
jgi:hypothetical protein